MLKREPSLGYSWFSGVALGTHTNTTSKGRTSYMVDPQVHYSNSSRQMFNNSIMNPIMQVIQVSTQVTMAMASYYGSRHTWKYSVTLRW